MCSSESRLDISEFLAINEDLKARFDALIIRFRNMNDLYEVEAQIQALRSRITNENVSPDDVESITAASRRRKELEEMILVINGD